MELLMLNGDAYLSTEELLVKVWGYETEAELAEIRRRFMGDAGRAQ